MSTAQPAVASRETNDIKIVELQGVVEVSPAGAVTWVLTQTNQPLYPFDRLRTGANSRVALRWSDESVVAFGASTELEILPQRPDAPAGLRLIHGVVSFFHRDQPGRLRVITRGAVAGVEGTEFVLAAAPLDGSERDTLSVIDGKVRFGNERATLLVTNGQQAVAEPGQAPVRTAGFLANNLLQWCFYYPAVLDPAELPLASPEQSALADSLAAYRSGDLLGALAKYPAGRQPGSDAERVYYAALLLSVGEVKEADAALSSLSAGAASERPQRLAAALRELIAAVKRQTAPSARAPELTTELMARSYYEQSRAVRQISLDKALLLARRAATNSPGFGFAWERVAELEFSFGRTCGALEVLDKSLALSPRNAQALALKGFLLAAQNRTRDAINWFDRALAADAALGNAWLGRGLCRIQAGDFKAGREDLLVAAALEPQRAELRSYLGKAYAAAGDFRQASRELRLARTLDPNDPTAWLYSALVNQDYNRINTAIRDLEKSEELNDNRSVYRSQLLLDQDQAVRSANLAAMYRDAGMSDVGLREAGRAVNYDYANYSAHLFLANSYSLLSDPNLVNLRYETPAENEYLLANLLAPASAGPISPIISQQTYSPLFERNRLGVVSSTEYLSRGAWTQSGAQFGTFGDLSYDLDAYYRSDPGQQVNNDLEQRQLSLAVKAQLTPEDSVFVKAKDYEDKTGDLAQRYDPNSANPTLRSEETQRPIVGLGYHHEWSPGMHTLLYATRLDDTISLTNMMEAVPVAFRPDVDPETMPGVTRLSGVVGLDMREQFRGELEIYSTELQQVWELPAHTTVVGGRFQYGNLETTDLENLPSTAGAVFPPPGTPAAQQDLSWLFRRLSFYGYHQWQIADPLQLIGGIAYDRLTMPENFRYAPVSPHEETADQVSPKAGLIWTPLKDTTVRFAYTRSLAGASMDQGYQLEPSQVAGFVQSFRSIIPESVAGANAGAKFETFDLSLEQRFTSGTYLGVSGEILNSEVNRTVGSFDVLPDELDYAVPSGLNEHLDYQEQSLLFTANQLVGDMWSFGGRYRLSRAVLNDNFPDVPDNIRLTDFQPRQRFESILHEVSLFAGFNHPCGFFAEAEANWYAQNNRGFTPSEPGDDFWHFNAFAGYRFARRKAEIALGLLNIGNQDYRLEPLNLYEDLPRSRTLLVRFQLSL